MGRARLVMDLIRNPKARKTTYMKRKRGLVKKAFELNTLCGVDVCLLMHGPNTSSTDQPEIWPQDPNEVKRIINKYKAKTCNTPPKSYDLQDFFHDRKSKIEVEACKLRKEMLEIKYPAWDTRFDALSEQQLKKFITVLDKKIEACGQKLNEMKNNPNLKKTGASPSGVMINVEPTRSASCFNVMNSMPNVQMISTSMVKTPIHNQAMPLSPQIMLPFDSNKMQSGFLPHPHFGVLKPRSNNIQGTTTTNPLMNSALNNYDPKSEMMNTVAFNYQNSPICYYNGSMQPMQQYVDYHGHLLTLPSQSLQPLPSPLLGFDVNHEYFDSLEAQRFNYVNSRK